MRAVRAAAEMRERLAALNTELEAGLGRHDRRPDRCEHRGGRGRRRRAAASALRPATRSTSPSASRRPRRPARSCSASRRTGSCAMRSRSRRSSLSGSRARASRSAPTGCSASRKTSRAARGASTRRWSVASGSSPPWSRRTSEPSARARATCSRCSARRVSASRGSSPSSSPGSATRPRSCEAAACRTARASRTGRWPRRCADATATIRWPGSQASLEGDEAALIAERIAAAVDLGGSPGPSDETAWAVRRLFEAEAKARPLVVLFDDLQWAEPTFLDLVEHLADWSRDAPILLICLARPEFLDERPGWGGGKFNATSALLERLSDGESAELVTNLLGRAQLDEDVRDRIMSAAEGNPLFVEEMLAHAHRRRSA